MNLEEQKEIAEQKLKETNDKIEKKKTLKLMKGKTKFYHFRQNNSGGRFVEDENVCVHVFIEAHSVEEANLLADNFGIYFDGCEQGFDCSCCGDRWYEVYEEGVEETPLIYSQGKMVDVKKAFKDSFSDKCIIHYLNGKREMIIFKTEVDCPKHDYKQCYNIGRKCKICGKWEEKKKTRKNNEKK